MKKVALFGMYPPPYGGRSIHVKRLKGLLKDNSYKVHVYSNTGSHNEVRKVKSIVGNLFREKYDFLHFHDRNFKLISFLVFFSKVLNYKTVLTYHSFRDNPEDYSILKKLLFKYCMRRLDHIVCVGESERNKLLNYVSEQKISIIPSYLHPVEDNNDYKKIPSEVFEFIEKQGFLIAANGNIRFFEGEDLYGLDMLIELLFKLKNDDRITKNIGMLFSLLDVDKQTDEEKIYYEQLKIRIKDYNLQDRIYIYEVNQTEFYPILKRASLFIRPTNVDSFGVSIAEAIHYVVPSIASNVCNRPNGTILFESRDIEDLYNKTMDMIQNYEMYKSSVKKVINRDYGIEHLRLYESFRV